MTVYDARYDRRGRVHWEWFSPPECKGAWVEVVDRYPPFRPPRRIGRPWRYPVVEWRPR